MWPLSGLLHAATQPWGTSDLRPKDPEPCPRENPGPTPCPLRNPCVERHRPLSRPCTQRHPACETQCLPPAPRAPSPGSKAPQLPNCQTPKSSSPDARGACAQLRSGPGAPIPGHAPAHLRRWRQRQRRGRPAGFPEAAAATQLAVQELHRGVGDLAPEETEACGGGSPPERGTAVEGRRPRSRRGSPRAEAPERAQGMGARTASPSIGVGPGPSAGRGGPGPPGGRVAIRIGPRHLPPTGPWHVPSPAPARTLGCRPGPRAAPRRARKRPPRPTAPS